MYKNKKILAIIPARGGSKGLPNKNIKRLLGKPLIGWTIEQAKNSRYVTDIYISTDSQAIATVSESFGVNVSELRPAELATDSATSVSLVNYAIDRLKKEGKEFDYFILLEPTSPLRDADDLDNMIQLAIDNSTAYGVVSLGEIHMEHPLIAKKINKQQQIVSYISDARKITQRQQANTAYFPYGVGYLVKVQEFLHRQEFYNEDSLPYFIKRHQCYEIDDIYDFLCVEAVLNNII